MAVAYGSSQSVVWRSAFLRYIVLAVVGVLIIHQLVRHQSYLQSTWNQRAKDTAPPFNVPLAPGTQIAGNSTMGFEKIIVINMPGRGDRRDRMALVSAHTGIHLEYSDGFKAEDVDPKSVPPHWSKNTSPGNLGSYRSHVNALRRVVENGYRTALLMEDDLDWDVHLDFQLPLFATNLPQMVKSGNTPLSQQAKQKTPNAPYGLDWDIMWLGTCLRPEPPADAHSYKDPVSEETHKIWDVDRDVACTHAYAVTYESAKMLLTFALDLDTPWDVHVSQFCKVHVCPIIHPPLIGFHQPVGPVSKGSDISSQGDTNFREDPTTIYIKHSALMELTNAVEPKKTFPKHETKPKSEQDKSN